MPAVVMNAAVPAPGVGPAGPASPADPVPADDGAFACALAEAQGPDAEDDVPPAATEAGPPTPVVAASPPPAALAPPPEGGTAPAIASTVPAAGAPGATAGPTDPVASTVPGWPPPGLAALFPADATAGDPFAPATPMAPVVTPGAAKTAAGPDTAPPAASAPTTLRGLLAGLAGGVASPEASAPDAPRPAAPAAAVAASSPTTTAPPIALAAAADAAMPLKLEALRAVATPITLREAMAASVDAPTMPVGPDGLDVTAWSPLAPAPLPRLDLAAAFPAPVPVHDPRFAEAMATRVQWMAEQGGGEVTLRVAPEGLGPVEIRLQLDGDRVDLGLQAAQADTRQALQDALPKLREMLSQSGLQLGHADVGQRHSSGASPNGEGREGARSFAGESRRAGESDERAAPIVVRAPQRGNGLLDLYA